MLSGEIRVLIKTRVFLREAQWQCEWWQRTTSNWNLISFRVNRRESHLNSAKHDFMQIISQHIPASKNGSVSIFTPSDFSDKSFYEYKGNVSRAKFKHMRKKLFPWRCLNLDLSAIFSAPPRQITCTSDKPFSAKSSGALSLAKRERKKCYAQIPCSLRIPMKFIYHKHSLCEA